MKKHFLVDENGRKVAVVVPIREYNSLIEDLHDLQVTAQRRGEPTLSRDELVARLQADGSLERP